ncbi:acyltransferase [Streptomyces kronopolitis]|uniref:acyltransferase n=1 Tax=Streptomyces kronopolitis TaxID=1612435 RepID=UPI00341DEDDE
MSRHQSSTLVKNGSGARYSIPLSTLDATLGAVSTGRTFFFHEPLDGASMRESLARVLATYPLLSGRVEREADGRLRVICNDRGVPFEEVSLPIRARDFMEATQGGVNADHSALPKSSVTRVTGKKIPTLSVKLTHFSCGGSALGVRMKHVLADGQSYMQFMLDWAAEHRGVPYSIPCHDRQLLDGLGYAISPQELQYSERFGVPSKLARYALLSRMVLHANKIQTVTLRFEEDEIRNMKRAAGRILEQADWISSADALTAHLWRALSELRGQNGSPFERLSSLVNFKRSITEVPPNYWGNTVTSVKTWMGSREIGTRHLGEVALLVRRAVSTGIEEDVRRDIAYLLRQRSEGNGKRVMPNISIQEDSNLTQFNNRSRIPYYDLSFNRDFPFRLEMPKLPIPWSVQIMPTPEKDGSREVHLSLPSATAENLASESAWMVNLHRYAS